MDDNEAAARRFHISKLPTVLFFRGGGATLGEVAAKIEGGGGSFVQEFTKCLQQLATPEVGGGRRSHSRKNLAFLTMQTP